MAAQTFYLSRIIGNKIYSDAKHCIGKLVDLVVDTSYERPKIIAVKVKSGKRISFLDFSHWQISKTGGQYRLKCNEIKEIEIPEKNTLFLVKHILDKQIVDMFGRKVVRVNDLRLAAVSTGAFVIAVDVGIEGLLRRIGIAKPIKFLLKPLKLTIPSKFIIWEDVETINFSRLDIKLSKEGTKLETLHPSDLADIIEDLDRTTQLAIFNSLNEEHAADVLEEMEPDAQIELIENLSVEKAADVLEKMPADEAADLLDELEDEKAEELLQEMEHEASQEVRELMEYPDSDVGSLMSTDFFYFSEIHTVNDVLHQLRRTKPETNTIYSLFILDNKERLVATVSLRDLIVSEPDVPMTSIMNKKFTYVFDDDKTKWLAEIISKYNLLAIPVVNHEMQMLGTVVVDDVIDQLMD